MQALASWANAMPSILSGATVFGAIVELSARRCVKAIGRYACGSSLVELVITLVVVGVLSAAAVSSIDASTKHNVTIEADQLRRALSHLQLIALNQGSRLKLTVSSTGYAVCAAATVTCNSAVAITDPATGSPFSRTLTNGASFVSGTGDYYFDSLGRPVVASTGATLLSTTTTLSINGVGRATAATVTVLPITGFAQTAY